VKYVRVQAAHKQKYAGEFALTPARVLSSITTTTQRVPCGGGAYWGAYRVAVGFPYTVKSGWVKTEVVGAERK
jgi:hypothetical protein